MVPWTRFLNQFEDDGSMIVELWWSEIPVSHWQTVKTHCLYNSLLLLHKPSCLPVMRSTVVRRITNTNCVCVNSYIYVMSCRIEWRIYEDGADSCDNL